ncbi:MAG: O-antigen ligase family protein, partial [bacterium]|nr:O-antigen ligase family protein [bacterium]
MQVLFYILFFFTPLALWPFTSELFEFNKMVLVYVLTTLITGTWIIRMVLEKKIIFRRTILDIPLICFLVTSLLSTIFSIDPRTSIFGYYSRFNGGLLSAISYTLLYWAYVSNMDQKKTLSVIRYTLLAAVLVCIYGILEHFGIDKDLWVQDVQNRIFSTLGQPNWLAAYLVALIPLTWSFALRKHAWLILNLLFFITLLFTKSRSGILGFAVADAIFWGLILWKHKKEYLRQFVICHFFFLIIAGMVGTPWTPTKVSVPKPAGPALEVGGGTESGEIRKIVWKGAIDIWKHNILLGTGPETFAFAYYMHRPVEHNLVSEWDFIYNKAHNEYLNIMANTGTLGLVSYLAVVIFSIVQISKIIPGSGLAIALIAGYASILITNFFGFSVVPVALEFFLFPAMAVALGKEKPMVKNKTGKLNNWQIILITTTLLAICYTLYIVSRYWYADVLYNKAKQYNSAGKYPEALSFLQQAVKLSPNEALYRSELSQTSAGLAVALFDLKREEEAQKFTDFAVAQ